VGGDGFAVGASLIHADDLPRDGVGGELSLDRLEQVAVENGLMLSPVHLTR
jgi:hypothetical protein